LQSDRSNACCSKNSRLAQRSSRAPKQKAIFVPSPDEKDEKPQKKEGAKHATPTFDTYLAGFF